MPKSTILLADDDKSLESLLLIGRSNAMQEIYRTLAKVVNVDLTVMIKGESGTGKELIAKALHNLSDRKHKPFIVLNMSLIPKELVEIELFGNEKGAFEQAEGGTLFLDEIGEMPLEAQARLLRALQQGEYTTTIGGTRTITVKARIISATHRDLEKLVKKGVFREDLYYRLNVVSIKAPPLRERREDIDELTRYFLIKANDKGLPLKEISPDAMPILQGYRWNGNVRELENLIYRLTALYSEEVISADIIKKELLKQIDTSEQDLPLPDIIRKYMQTYFMSHGDVLPSSGIYDRLMPLFERPLLEVTLEATEGNQLKAANLLGINRNTLRKKISELGIEYSKKRFGSEE